VAQLCADMQHYDVKDYITGSQLMLEYSEQVLLDLDLFPCDCM